MNETKKKKLNYIYIFRSIQINLFYIIKEF